MFSSLRVKNFRIYWFGMFASLVGTWIQAVALSWLVFELTHSAFLLGVVGFLTYIPIFLLSLFGGVLADRMNKRDILICTQVTFMLLAFILATLTQLKLITPLHVMAIALLNGMVMAFDAPSRQAMVVELVGKENLFNAIALNSVAFNSSRVIGPAFAGILVATIGMSGCFYINGISFLALIFALSMIKIKNNPKMNKNNKVLKDLKDGIAFIKNNPSILVLISTVSIISLFGVGYIILMPIFANDVLGVGVRGLGFLMSSAGIGALIGGLSLAKLGDFKYKGKLLVVSSFVFSISLLFFALSKSYILSILALLFMGSASVIVIALVNTLLQTKVDDQFRGRVMSVFMLAFIGIIPFGNLIAGTLAQVMGVSIALIISGCISTIFFLAINILFPGIRKI
ncbi:MAG: MFS transporter [Candidatus Omnitrophica bacterium]|nr:MFS transporter [Candidatus Omnitrophota bacterium]